MFMIVFFCRLSVYPATNSDNVSHNIFQNIDTQSDYDRFCLSILGKCIPVFSYKKARTNLLPRWISVTKMTIVVFPYITDFVLVDIK